MKILKKEVAHISRREFLKFILGLSVGYILAETLYFLVAVEAAKHIKISEHTILSNKLAGEWNDTVIVHFSDMHISPRGTDFINPGVIQELSIQVQRYLEHISADPSKTFFIDTGDMVSSRTAANSPTPLVDLEESLSYVRGIPAQRFFAVPGNHEYGHRLSPSVLNLIQSSGIELLGDLQIKVVNSVDLPFCLVALPDYTSQSQKWYQNRTPEILVSRITAESQKPLIIAAHTSIADVWGPGFLENDLSGALFLHGHTHGGQVWGRSPAQYAASQYALHHYNYPSQYFRGVQVVGKKQDNIVSVSSGIGHAVGHKVRTSKPEVVVYRLKTP